MSTQSIFIVEDEIITARSIAKNIRKFGYQVAGIATSGSQAVEEILNTKPNLVLMDILLDEDDMDGITTAREIRSQLNVPVIYLTAHCDRETLDRAKITTPFGYILKPYSKKQLEINIELSLHKHQQEMQLVRREELLSTILNATQDSVLATNETSKIIYMNPAAENLTGWQLSENREYRATEVLRIIDERTKQPLNPIEQVLEKGEVIYLDKYAVLIKKSGEQVSIGDSASPILKGDRVVGAVLIFAPYRTSASEINSVNTQQNLPIYTIAGDDELEELSISFLDLLLHELRTPLTIILSSSESLRRYRHRWTAKKQDSNLKRIQQAIGQITWLLDNLSVWGELGREEINLQPYLINVVDLSQEILSDIEGLDAENHKFVLSHRGEERMVYLDRGVLRCILTNLLLNAVKYSPIDSTIALSIERQEDYFLLRVQDRGIGIPSAEQEQIFEPFYRGSNTGSIGGTGLGLAIVKKYVLLCEGNISLESSSSSTTFTVSLPYF